ncbi:hypothetical protein LEMLEM_LOCUS14662 [Lemmus lemmus]
MRPQRVTKAASPSKIISWLPIIWKMSSCPRARPM